MKRSIILSVLFSLFCVVICRSQPPLKGKFMAEPSSPAYMDQRSYLIFKADYRFAFHYEDFPKGCEEHGDWEYTDEGTIKLTFDPGDPLAFPPTGWYIKDTVKIINVDTLSVFYLRFYENNVREFVRVPEE